MKTTQSIRPGPCPRSLLLLLAALLAPAPAAQSGPGREILDLSGAWQIRADPGEEGVEQAWYRPDSGDGWNPIVVPSTWETALGEDFDGTAWYRRRFVLPPQERPGRVLLRGHGAATAARVWVNGREAGGHLGAWTPFTLDVTGLVEWGVANRVTVRLEERPGHNTQGFLPVLAPHFGGLWQKVEVILTGPAWIDDGRIAVTALPLDPGGGRREGRLEVDLPWRGELPPGTRLRYTLHPPREQDGTLTRGEIPLAEKPATVRWQGRVETWSVGRPRLYRLETALIDGRGRLLDRVHTLLGFRRLDAEGPRLLLNGEPLSVRGFLTWGVSPPRLAPVPRPEAFRRRLRYFRSCGFNLVKFCLWLPPAAYLEICDREGMLAWIEYPTWHPRIDREHREELLREYDEFSAHDRNHPAAVLRSITCETGPAADLAVLTELYRLLKERAPGTLVEDDSSWIGWNRVHDFWDDHAYGNNRSWREKLAALHRHREKKGMKPLLLGEAVAADTWPDTARLQDQGLRGRPWWAPRWLADQVRFERELGERWDGPGFRAVADLHRTSLDYALAMRRWQLETFRARMPHAGYVVSVVRDVKLCAMGLLDYFGRPKWPPHAWSWHGAEMAALRTPGDCRAFPAGRPTKAEVVFCGPAGVKERRNITIIPDPVQRPAPFTIAAPVGQPAARWRAWALPEPPPVPKGLVLYGAEKEGLLAHLFPGARQLAAGTPPGEAPLVASRFLDPTLIDYLEKGGRLLHLASRRRGSFRVEGTWFLRGTVWAPPVPAPFFHRVPRALLTRLQLHGLGGSGVIRGERLWRRSDPLLLFVETHDLERVRPNLLLFAAGWGRGRLLVSALRHRGGRGENPAGLWLARELARHLLQGPRPSRALDEPARAALRAAAGAAEIGLPGPWRFRRDPQGQGLDRGWHEPGREGPGWLTLDRGSAAEGKAWQGYDGWGWYRRQVEIPASWRGRRVHLVCESVDDMYELYVNGEKAGGHGRMDRSVTSYLRRTWVDVTSCLRYGEKNLLVLRVYDWYGAAGLNGEVRLTTGPVEKELDFLQH